jgi:hypothetical protein
MSAQNDFYLTLDRAAGLTLDATCAARSAGTRSLPTPHRHRLDRVIRRLESAQQDLFMLRNDPWSTAGLERPRQLELL